MTNFKTRSLALVAAVLMSGCSTTNYYGDQSGNYAYDNNGYTNQYDQPDQYTQYNDQPVVDVDADVGVSFDTFERELAPYGNWTNHPRWGDVWQPLARTGFRPYFNGYWANTSEYGWMWISDDPWDVTYHYGRWVYDPRDGWLWVPGYVWGPAWVVWRSGAGSVGWFPMPPDDNYYGNGPYNGNYARFYGYRDWYGPSFGNDQFFSLWVFVGEDRFADRNYRNYVMPQRDNSRIIIQTNETTNYVTVNNYVINRSVNVERVERASNRRFAPVAARSVMRRDAVVIPVETGRRVEERERQRPQGVGRGLDRARQLGNGGDNNGRGPDNGRGRGPRDVPPPQNAQVPPDNNVPNGRGPDNGRGRGPRDFQQQNVPAPQNANQAPERRDPRQERLERLQNRGRFQAPQNANLPQNVPPQNVAPPNVQGPQNGNPERVDRRQERLEQRQRAQEPQNVPQQDVQRPPNMRDRLERLDRGASEDRGRGPGPQNANVAPPTNNVEAPVQRAVERPDNNGNGRQNQAERVVERPQPPANNGNGNGGGNGNQPAVQAAAASPSTSPPAADRAAAREERAAERDARRDERKNGR